MSQPDSEWPYSAVVAFTPGNDWYASLASLLSDGFPTVSSESISTLDRAAHALARSIIVADKIIDSEVDELNYPSVMEAVLGFQYLAYDELYSLFPRSSPFWVDFRRYATISALTTTSGHQLTTREELYEQIRSRNALHNGIFAALCTLANCRERLHDLEEAMSSFCVALQLVDDLHDWQADFSKARLTAATFCAGNADDLFLNGTAEMLIGEAIAQLAYAKHIAMQHGFQRWPEFLEVRIASFDTFRNRLSAARARQSTWSNRVIGVRRFGQSDFAVDAIQGFSTGIERLALRLCHAWQDGFSELRHLMEFPREGGFGGSQTLKSGDLFGRLLTLDAISRVPFTPRGRDLYEQMVTIESKYLESLGERDPLGHRVWKYFPDLPELPADIDDLAELLRFASRTARGYLHDDIRVSIGHIVYDRSTHLPETWIVPPISTHPVHERQRHYIESSWGRGCDPEVAANFFDAATTSGIRTGVDETAALHYFESQQRTDGLWNSTWYVGPYYGTFAILRAIRHMSDCALKHAIITRAISGLHGAMTQDGAWGLNGREGDALSSALAILTLDLAGVNAAPNQALELLLAESEHFIPFIKMDIPQHGGKKRTLFYGSHTVTTAFAIRALLAANTW